MEIKKRRFDMYWAFLTGLGVQQDTLGAQNISFFFGCTGREHCPMVLGGFGIPS